MILDNIFCRVSGSIRFKYRIYVRWRNADDGSVHVCEFRTIGNIKPLIRWLRRKTFGLFSKSYFSILILLHRVG